MTTPAGTTEHVAAVHLLMDEVHGFVRLLHAFKAQAADRSAHGLLFPLRGMGPARLTALADAVHTDPSTTSRQVGELVREGLVRREADPDDRRAWLLVVTDAGHRRVEEMRTQRATQLSEALGDWSPEDIAGFTTSFRRFTDGMRQSLGGSVAACTTPTTPQEAR